MKVDYKTNFAGYLTILRAVQFLLKSKTLSFAQLGAYICFIAQADYDPRHRLYGVITRDDEEIAKALGFDRSTIYLQRKALVKKGLLIEENGYTKIPNFYIFEHKWVKGLAKAPTRLLQRLIEDPQKEIEDLQKFVEQIQQARLQKQGQSFRFSSKGDLSFSEEGGGDNYD